MDNNEMRARRQRPNQLQLERLLSLVEKNNSLHTSLTLSDPLEAKKVKAKWEAVAESLNNVGGAGAIKDGIGWRETWKKQVRDVKKTIRKSDMDSACNLKAFKQRISSIIESQSHKIPDEVETHNVSEESTTHGSSNEPANMSCENLFSSEDRGKRQRPTHAQLELLISLVENDLLLHNLPMYDPIGADCLKRKWGDAAVLLNQLPGAKKDGLGWRDTWKKQVHGITTSKHQTFYGKNVGIFKQRIMSIVGFKTTDTPKPQPDQAIDIPTIYQGVDNLVVTVRSTDLINLIPVKTIMGDVIFSCGTCNYPNIFKTSENLIIHHFREHSDKYQVWCKKCDIGLANNNILNHVKYHFDEQDGLPNGAPNVKLEFDDYQAEQENVDDLSETSNFSDCNEFHAKLLFVCEVCNLEFVERSELEQHMINVHNAEPAENPPIKSELASSDYIFDVDLTEKSDSFIVSNQTEFSGHLNHAKKPESSKSKTKKSFSNSATTIDSSNISYRCSECEESFSSKLLLKKHSKVHKAEKPCLCQFCGKSFISSATYRQHLFIHNEEDQYRCEHCPKRFVKRFKLKMHMRHHIQDKNYLCPKCGEAFELPGKLVTHIRKFHVEGFVCTVCNLKFDDNSQLLTHLNDHPGSSKLFQCNYCGKTYARNQDLRKHQLTHLEKNEEKPFKCQHCPKSFTGSYLLNTHIASHTKPFKCDICLKTFALRRVYQKHMDWHSGVRFPCEVCGKSFARAKILADHMNTHTGRTPYQCLLCEKSFAKKNHYSYHIATRHN